MALWLGQPQPKLEWDASLNTHSRCMAFEGWQAAHKLLLSVSWALPAGADGGAHCLRVQRPSGTGMHRPML